MPVSSTSLLNLPIKELATPARRSSFLQYQPSPFVDIKPVLVDDGVSFLTQLVKLFI